MIMAQARSTLVNRNRRLSRRQGAIRPFEGREGARMERFLSTTTSQVVLWDILLHEVFWATLQKQKTRNSEGLVISNISPRRVQDGNFSSFTKYFYLG
jgi:hypothetical protein